MFNTLCFKIWLCFISVWFSLPIKLISTNCYSLLKRQCWVLGNMTQYSASYVSMKTWVWFTQEPSVEAQLWLQPWGNGVIGWTQVAPWSQPASVWPSGAVTDSCLKNKVEKDTWSWALVSISRYGLHKGREVEREAKRNKKEHGICQDFFNLAIIFLQTKCHRQDGSALAAKTDGLDFNSWNPDSKLLSDLHTCGSKCKCTYMQ